MAKRFATSATFHQVVLVCFGVAAGFGFAGSLPLLGILGLVGALVTVILGYARIRTALNTIGEMEVFVRRLARDDITTLPPLDVDAIGRLGQALRDMSTAVSDRTQALQEERNRLSAILVSIQDVVVALGPQGRIVLVNPAAERFFQSSRNRLVGKKLLEILRHHELAEAFNDTLRADQVMTREVVTRDTPPRILQAHLGPIHDSQDRVIGAVGVLRDITELRHLEKVRTEFVANVSHELRTPLTSIKGFIETLLDGALENRETAERFLHIVSGEVERLAQLTSDLLDLSRLEAKDAELTFAAVDLGQLIQDVAHVFRRRIETKGLTLTIEIAPDLPVAEGDPSLLRQVLTNLLDNAVKYTAGEGGITVSAEAIRDAIHVKVRDTGMGIPKAELSRLFERFYRVDKARSRAMGGTGLGLSIVKHIVERHGGRVWAESEPDRGSTFTFTVPVRLPHPPNS